LSSISSGPEELLITAVERVSADMRKKIDVNRSLTQLNRSVLTRSKRGVCVGFCKNLASSMLAQRGDAVGIIAAHQLVNQSQLTSVLSPWVVWQFCIC